MQSGEHRLGTAGSPGALGERIGRAWSVGCRPDGTGRVRCTFRSPGDAEIWAHTLRCRCFPQSEYKPSGTASEAGYWRPQQPGPPSPGLSTWRRAAPAASRGRIGPCRRRAPARAASRGLGCPRHPPRQGTRRAQPAIATGVPISGPRRHQLAGVPSNAAPEPSSPPPAAYLAQARPGERERAGPEGQGPGGNPMGGVCLVKGVTACLYWSR